MITKVGPKIKNKYAGQYKYALTGLKNNKYNPSTISKPTDNKTPVQLKQNKNKEVIKKALMCFLFKNK